MLLRLANGKPTSDHKAENLLDLVAELESDCVAVPCCTFSLACLLLSESADPLPLSLLDPPILVILTTNDQLRHYIYVLCTSESLLKLADYKFET